MNPKVPHLPSVRHPRAARPNLHRAALLQAGTELFSTSGPAGVSIRQISALAGCSHTLIGQQFGSKKGLEDAVLQQAIGEFANHVLQLCAAPELSFAAMITWLREHEAVLRLLSRHALGEFEGADCGNTKLGDALVHKVQSHVDAPASARDEVKLSVFAALAMILGQLSLDNFMTRASRVDQVPQHRRDAVLAEAAHLIADLPVTGGVDLSAPLTRQPATPEVYPDLTKIDSRRALVQATILLYASQGPAALTTREIADLARVNQGLIYHYFHSREALLAEALTEANLPLLFSLPQGVPLDLPTILRAVAGTPTHRMLVRLEVNGVPIDRVRTNFPVYDRLLEEFPKVPKGARTAGLKDPRMAVMLGGSLGFGAALWDAPLRQVLQIPTEADLIPAFAGIIGHLFDSARS
jgi:AcrR family transcriptional regulator